MHAILNWRTHYGSLADSLRGITYVDHYEIVKFLEEVFNALFEVRLLLRLFGWLFY